MKTLLICLMLLAGIKSNGQSKKLNSGGLGRIQVSGEQGQGVPYVKADTTSWLSIFLRESQRPTYTILFQKDSHVSAYNKFGSDTLFIVDTVLEFDNNKIRYIKIGDKVYPLKTN